MSSPPTKCELHDAAVRFVEQGIPFDIAAPCVNATCWVCHDAIRYAEAARDAIGGPALRKADEAKERLKAVVAAYQKVGLGCISARDTDAADKLPYPSMR
jgi:hypothetical protein